MLKPLLKWAGGKRWLVPIIKKLYKGHEHRCFVEPFCGGMAVTLGLLPKHAVLNDINPHLINFYRWVGKGLEFTIEMRNDRDLYYAHRRRFNELIRQGQADTAEAAQLFFYLTARVTTACAASTGKASSMFPSASISTSTTR